MINPGIFPLRFASVQGLRYPGEDDVYEKPILNRLGYVDSAY
jgi:hypothetical protein